MKTALLAPGQGSQYVGMMKDLYEHYPQAKDLIDLADEILGYKLSQICFNGPLEELKKTKYTQPALFLHSAVVYVILKNKLEFDCVAGHSVGEYAALYWAF
jgi:[acyl-carrier-protein] S-malonyltransferase